VHSATQLEISSDTCNAQEHGGASPSLHPYVHAAIATRPAWPRLACVDPPPHRDPHLRAQLVSTAASPVHPPVADVLRPSMSPPSAYLGPPVLFSCKGCTNAAVNPRAIPSMSTSHLARVGTLPRAWNTRNPRARAALSRPKGLIFHRAELNPTLAAAIALPHAVVPCRGSGTPAPCTHHGHAWTQNVGCLRVGRTATRASRACLLPCLPHRHPAGTAPRPRHGLAMRGYHAPTP
jgi:hypothetical protein